MEYVTIILAAFIVSALTLFSGFGLGTLLMPAFALFFPVETAIAATAIVHFSNNIFKGILLGRDADRSILLRFGLFAAAASFTGAIVLELISHIPPVGSYYLWGRMAVVSPVKLVLGFVMLLFALFELSDKLQNIKMEKQHFYLGGLLSGFFGGLSGHQGALRSMFLLHAGLNKQQYIATGVMIAIIIDIARLIVYGAGIIPESITEIPGLIIAGVIAALAGTVIGTRLIKKVTFTSIRYITAGLLLIIAVALGMGMI
ncbi:MAG: sulfite exporter TauE/SafE family protein [Ignavibacteriaceae bacterium]|nr:sulfite exporter TauE/SafE family protein [Ignavibacteriaceae bacterium]